jgi:AcrR family transcriptional regulator
MADQPDPSTRQRLIDATLEVIAEHGVEAVKVVAIAERADTTTGSLYWFFKSRRGLVNAALAEQFAKQMRIVIDVIAAVMEQSDVTIDMIFQQRFDVSDPKLVTARRQRIDVLAAALSDPELRTEVAAIQREVIQAATKVVEDAQARGFARTDVDAYSYALYIQSMTVGFAIADLAPDLMPNLENWWGVSRLIVEAIKKP